MNAHASTYRPNELDDADRPQTVIALRDLHKSHGKTVALQGLSLTVPRGTIYALLGPNGSGKTTTLKLLLGMSRPDRGEGRVFGLRIDNEADSVSIRSRVGFVSETKELFQQLDVRTTINMVRKFYPKWQHDLELRLLSEFALTPTQRVSALSKGMRAKLALLVACCRGAELLILDEPTDGLDPASADQLLETLVGMVAETGVTVLLSSHQLHEVERIADGVAIMHHGRVVLQGELDELRGEVRRIDVQFDAHADAQSDADHRVSATADIPRIRVLPNSIPDGTLLLHHSHNAHEESLLIRGNAAAVVATLTTQLAATPHHFTISAHPVPLRELFLTLTNSSF
ncbi:MAG: ABC transporter ATP-binding protein [Gemmatimonadaceae bacterium]